MDRRKIWTCLLVSCYACVDGSSNRLSLLTSVFAFELLAFDAVFSLVDSILADRFWMSGGPIPRQQRLVIGRAGK